MNLKVSKVYFGVPLTQRLSLPMSVNPSAACPLRHYEHHDVHLQSDIEKLPVPISGSMLPFSVKPNRSFDVHEQMVRRQLAPKGI